MLLVMVAFAVCNVLKDNLGRPIEYLYPTRVFLLGKEIERHEKIKLLRHNILWGIIIAFIVGVIGGIFVWLITK